MAGYHLTEIEKGKLGDPSKIIEEARELEDAARQGVKILMLVELSDIYGALEACLKKHAPGMTMKDLADMHRCTKRAFDNGRR